MKEFLEWLNTSTGFQLVFFIIILVVTYIFARLFKRFFERTFIKTNLAAQTDPTNYRFLMHFFRAIIIITGIGTAIYIIPSLRSLSTSLLAGAGIFAVAIGFASQKAFSNIISGLFIVIFKPFRVSDRIMIGTDIAGTVEDITLRHTIVKGFDSRRIIIPNSNISEAVIFNADIVEEKICKFLFVTVSYDADLDLAIDIIRKIVEEHPLVLDNRNEEQVEKGEPKVVVKVLELGNFGIKLRASAWAKDTADGFTINCDFNKAIVSAFKEAGIEIPKGYQWN